ncbi:MAG: M1 family metallopeptidase [Bacteroidota bacterium]
MRSLVLLFFLLPMGNYSQQENSVDFTRADALIKLYKGGAIAGTVRYSVTVAENAGSIAFDAVNMEFSDIYLENRKLESEVRYDGNTLILQVDLKPGEYEIKLGYTAQPKQTVYFMGWNDKVTGNEQIWTQGQGKYTSHWLPSFDDMTEKVEFDLAFHVPEKYTVIANGALKNVITTAGFKTWQFDMAHPMSSYLVAFVVGHFEKKVMYASSGVPIELYYEQKDSLKVEPTYRYTKAIFDFLETEIGVPYPWQVYKQVPVQDFLYAGMENTTSTFFSNQYMIDSTAFIDKNYVNVNAHELAHQWFGNFVTEQSGDHHWLHEGFATYYAYLAEQALFGDTHFYWKLYKMGKTLANLSENGDGEALTDPNASSLTFYEKGAFALLMLRAEVGNEAFQIGIKRYLEKYAYSNVTISDLIVEMEKAAGKDLSDFREEWLENEEFPWESVRSYLVNKEPSLQRFLEIKENVNEIGVLTPELLNTSSVKTPIPFKQQLLFEFHEKISDSALVNILASEDILVRQAAVLAKSKVNDTLRSAYESMLSDPSYVTQETVLFRLWEAFPVKRANYLDRLSATVGLPNKNVRLLWLTLALITPEYQPHKKKAFYDELNGYTALHHNFEVRQLAFQYLFQIQALNDTSLENLIQASSSAVWRFKKSSRKLLNSVNNTTSGKEQLRKLRQQLSTEQLEILNQVLVK